MVKKPDALVTCLLFASGLLAQVSPVHADAVSQLVFFGDSSFDDGSRSSAIKIDWVPYNSGGTLLGDSDGRPSNGPRATELLLSYNGLGNTGYLNYAHWGTLSGSDIGTAATGSSGSSLIDSAGQVARYLGSVGGTAPSDGVYFIRSGANDFANFRPSSAVTDTAASLANVSSAVTQIATAGGNRIFVTNYPVSTTADGFDGVYFTFLGSQIRLIEPVFGDYNAALTPLAASLRGTTGKDVVLVDFTTLYDYVLANPTLLGFDAATASDTCVDFGTGVTCDTTFAFSSAYDRLTWDGVHTSGLAAIYEAQYLYEYIMAPRVGLSVARAWYQLSSMEFDRTARTAPRFAPRGVVVPFVDVQRGASGQTETTAEGRSDLTDVTSAIGFTYGLRDTAALTVTSSWINADSQSQDGGTIGIDAYTLAIRADQAIPIMGQMLLGSLALEGITGLNDHERSTALLSVTQARAEGVASYAVGATARLETAYQVDWLSIRPSAALSIWRGHVNAWTEENAAAGLNVAASSVAQNVAASFVGVTLGTTQTLGSVTIRPSLGAHWRHLLGDGLGGVRVYMNSDSRFTQAGRGATEDGDTGIGDIGLTADFSEAINADFTYSRQFGASLTSTDSFGGRLRWAF